MRSTGADALVNDAGGATVGDLADLIDAAVSVAAASVAWIGAGEGDGEAAATFLDGGAASVGFVVAVVVGVAGDGDAVSQGAVEGSGERADSAGAAVAVGGAVIDAADVMG